MRGLSIAKLNEHLEGKETDIRRFSEELVQQLALRDELDFEKEVRNTFISTLIDVQNRQKEQRELMKRKRKEKNHRGGAGTPQGGADKSVSASCFIEGAAGASISHLSSSSFSPPQRFSVVALSSAIQSSFRHAFGSSCSERQVILSADIHSSPPTMEVIAPPRVLCSPFMLLHLCMTVFNHHHSL